MTPTPNLWRIQSDLIEMFEERDELAGQLASLRRQIVGIESPTELEIAEETGEQLEESIRAIESGIQKYVAAKLMQVDDLREPLIALAEGVELCKKRAAAETGRAMELQNRYDRLKDAIKQAMKFLEESGYWKPKQTRKVESPHGSFTLRGNGGAQPVEITDETLVPDEYKTVTIRLNLEFATKLMVSLAMEDWKEEEEFETLCTAFENGKREVSKSAMAEALNAPCLLCDGYGRIDSGPLGGPESKVRCQACGGSGKKGIPGARLAERGESLVIR